eukprot:232457_1
MGMLNQLKLLMNDEERIKFTVCFILSNITAEEQFIENVIHSKLVPVLIENVLNVNEYNSVRIRTESLWAITNAINSPYVQYFANIKFIDVISTYIPEIKHFDLITNTITSIGSLLNYFVSTCGILDLEIGYKFDSIFDCILIDDAVSTRKIFHTLASMPITIKYFDHAQLNYIYTYTAIYIMHCFAKQYIETILKSISICYENREYVIAKRFWKFVYRLNNDKKKYKSEQIKLRKKCKKMKCSNCDKKGLKSCIGCMKISYCSRKCQKKHWKYKHKYECRKKWIIQYSIFNIIDQRLQLL